MKDEYKELLDILTKNNGYIKGYGSTLYRVMTSTHSPVYNVKRSIVDELLKQGKLVRDNLIIKLNN